MNKKTPTRTGIAYFTLLTTADRLSVFFEAVVAPFDITRQQYNVLKILRGAGPEGLPTLVVAERMIELTPGITRMIDRLEAKGLVGRELRKGDRRCVYCKITEKGMDLLEALDEPVQQANRAAFSGLNQADLEQVIGLLEKIRKVCESKASDKPR